ncbi:MAG TPA: AraC family transcriptional regulator, partial [Bacteroidia bacterium]
TPVIVEGNKGTWVYVSAQDQLTQESIQLNSKIDEEVIEMPNQVLVEPDPINVVSNEYHLKVYFKPEVADKMKSEIDHYMINSRNYLDCDFNINRMAEDLGYTSRQLSSLLNSHSLTTFKDYVNRYRINLFIDKYKNDPKSNDKTMEELAMECGFHNRYTFIHAFKRINGKTPSAYFSRYLSPS